MAQFILVYTHPTEGEERFELAPGRSYRIGSKPDNDVVIDQKDVSRRHAVLRVQDGSFQITDLDSKNGTFINGAKVAAGTFGCGDMVHLSSARIVIVEVTTGSFTTMPEVITSGRDESTPITEDTQKYRSVASMEDVVTLLERTADAVSAGSLTEPLDWAVDALGFDGAVVLYRDNDGDVAMMSSVGDLGTVGRTPERLANVANEHPPSPEGTSVRQHVENGDNLLVASVGANYLLVMRYTGRPPAIGDLRSIIAAVRAVLASGVTVGQTTAPIEVPDALRGTGRASGPDAGGGLDLDELASRELTAARDAFETWMIERALAACDGNQTEAAKILGLSRTGLFKKMRKLGL
jgi:hypothetical protein